MIIAIYIKLFFFNFQDDYFVPFTCDDIKLDIRPEHRCSTKKDSKIQCIDENCEFSKYSVSVSIHWDVFTIGMEHSILFVYCTCEALAITLARAELWPATPTSPKFAFSFALRCHSQVNKVLFFYGMYIYKLHYVCNILSEAIANMMDKYFSLLFGGTAWYIYFSKKCTGNIGVVVLILVLLRN